MAAVSTIRRHVSVVLAVDGDLLAALKQLFDDDRLIRDHTGTAVGVEEADYAVHVPLRVFSQLIESGAIQLGPVTPSSTYSLTST